MQTKNNNPSFFDGKTLLLVAIVGLIYVGWQQYLQHKYPNYGKPAQQQAVSNQEQTTTTVKTSDATATSQVGTAAVHSPSEASVDSYKELNYIDDKVSFKISSQGLGIREYQVLEYKDRSGEPIKVGESKDIGLFEMRLLGDQKGLNFNIEDLGNGHFRGSALLGSTEVIRDLVFDKTLLSFKSSITVRNADDNFKKGFSLLIPERIHVQENSSWLFPSYEFQDFFVNHTSGKNKDVNFNKATEDVIQSFTNVSLVSVSSQYFAAAVVDKSTILPEVKVSSSVANKTALAELTYKPTQGSADLKFEEIFYVGPKAIDRLKAVDAELADIINFGFFGFISRPLLYIMKAFHGLVGNWGVAIILLTLLVRACVLPFNVMSFRSMKKMQKIQPIIQSIREKYKDDPAKLNAEMMKIMRENGANPLGGCLPMLLQIPIFFALYRVIGSSIELYQSPFILWITDLSSHDKFYVLPVSMAIFMYIQQKLTPSTMDPTQAKIMAFMPVIFSLFMLQLPSGLTLYMVVSTLFGIAQQYVIMREPSKELAKV